MHALALSSDLAVEAQRANLSVLLGESPFVSAMILAWTEHYGPVRVAGFEDRLDLATFPLAGPQPIWLRDGAHTLRVQDLTPLRSLARIAPILVTGADWGDAEFKAYLGSKKHSLRIYDGTRTNTPSARTLVCRWMVRETDMSPSIVKYVAESVDYREEAVVEFVKRAKFFPGRDMTSSLADVLMYDLRSDDIVDAILSFRGAEALSIARQVPESIRVAFRALPAKVGLMARMYPVVMRHPKPSVEASREAKVPLPTLSLYWSTAGRYSPDETVFRLRLLSSLSENSPRDYGALAALVALW